MVSEYLNLQKRIKKKISKCTDYIKIANELNSNGLNMSLSELLSFDAKKFQDLKCLKNTFCFIKYFEEAPKGINFIIMKDLLLETLDIIPISSKKNLQPFVLDTYLKTLTKELENEDIKNYIKWIEVYPFLKDKFIECKVFGDDLKSELSKKIENFQKDCMDIKNENEDIIKLEILLDFVKTLNEAVYHLEIESLISPLFNFIFKYLDEVYRISNPIDLDKDKKYHPKARELVKELKYLRLNNSENNILKQLQQIFCPMENSSGICEDLVYFKKNSLNLGDMKFIKTFYINSNNSNYSLSVNLISSSNYGNIAMKEYDIVNRSKIIDQINIENTILQFCSRLSDQNNFFLKYYGALHENKKVSLFMEYHEKTLLTVINELKNNSKKLSEECLNYFLKELVSAFIILEQEKIYHLNINPSNILVTEDWKLKIIDFSNSSYKNNYQNNIEEKGKHLIKCNLRYMAPEIQLNALADKSIKSKYSRKKVDVFSVGIVLLELYFLEEMQQINYYDNYSELLGKINMVQYYPLQNILKLMLTKNYLNRPTFIDCVKYIPGNTTSYVKEDPRKISKFSDKEKIDFSQLKFDANEKKDKIQINKIIEDVPGTTHKQKELQNVNFYGEEKIDFSQLKFDATEKKDKRQINQIVEDVSGSTHKQKELQNFNIYREEIKEISFKKDYKNTDEIDQIYNNKKIDFSTLFLIDTIYVNNKNPNFKVSIHHYNKMGLGDVALKVYELKKPEFDINNIANEIKILEITSEIAEKSSEETLFLKFYGCQLDISKISICMEYIPTTLNEELARMSMSKQRYTEVDMINYTRDLIKAFALLESLNIYHQDIKPHNILFTNNKKLKIIDFSVAYLGLTDEEHNSDNDLHYIQGTQGYMAPELQKHVSSSDRANKIKYKRNKADVFSLGITLLQMFSLEELYTLNFEENNSRLIKKVNQIPWMWFSQLLNKMLHVSNEKRPTFRECLGMIPGDITEYIGIKEANL